MPSTTDLNADLAKLDLNNNSSNVDQKIINNFRKIKAKNNEELIMTPYTYSLQQSDDRFGTELLMTFNHWLTVPTEITKVIQEVIEMVYNGSNLVNNLDEGPDPESDEPAHLVYGVPFTINCANYVYFLALVKLINNLPGKVNEAVTIFTEQLMDLHEGEELQVHWRDMLKCPSIEDYIEMVRKTNGLYGLGVRLLQLFSETANKESEYVSLMNAVGKFCRIRQDYLDMKLDPDAEDMSDFCRRLSDGKFSYPIVQAIQNDADDCYVMQIVKLRTKSDDIKKFFVSHIEKQGALTQTKEKLIEIEKEIMEQIEKLGGNPKLEAIMKSITMTPKKGKKGNKMF